MVYPSGSLTDGVGMVYSGESGGSLDGGLIGGIDMHGRLNRLKMVNGKLSRFAGRRTTWTYKPSAAVKGVKKVNW